jgi:hypothetical protein
VLHAQEAGQPHTRPAAVGEAAALGSEREPLSSNSGGGGKWQAPWAMLLWQVLKGIKLCGLGVLSGDTVDVLAVVVWGPKVLPTWGAGPAGAPAGLGPGYVLLAAPEGRKRPVGAARRRGSGCSGAPGLRRSRRPHAGKARGRRHPHPSPATSQLWRDDRTISRGSNQRA